MAGAEPVRFEQCDRQCQCQPQDRGASGTSREVFVFDFDGPMSATNVYSAPNASNLTLQPFGQKPGRSLQDVHSVIQQPDETFSRLSALFLSGFSLAPIGPTPHGLENSSLHLKIGPVKQAY